jgi:FKBP-type peptidyl-prolyl cis-trans isomerase
MNIHSSLALLLTATMVAGCNAQDQPAPAPEAQEQQQQTQTVTPEQIKQNVSYFFGYQSGSQMSSIPSISDKDIDFDVLVKGIKDGLNQATPSVSEEELSQSIPAFQKVLEDRQAEAGKANAELSAKWIAEMSKAEGVNKTETGLLYKVVEKGGDKKYEEGAYKNPLFCVDYKGTLPDGTVFDQSPAEGAEFPLQLIPGFTEALKMMPIGARWDLYIPANLAYGPQSPSPKIGPNQALHFELHLKEIKEAPAEQPQMTLSPEQLQELLEKEANSGSAE